MAWQIGRHYAAGKTSIVDFGRPVFSGHIFQSDQFNHHAGVRALFVADVWSGHDDACLQHGYGQALCCGARPGHFNCTAWPYNQRIGWPGRRCCPACAVRLADNLDYFASNGVDSCRAIFAPFDAAHRLARWRRH